MCVMWFWASDMGKPTFSKCFVVLSVMLGEEFSFCFALGQIQPRDKISSPSLEFGIASVKAEAESGEMCFVRTRRGFPVNGRKARIRVQRCSHASAENQSCAESTGAKMQSHAGVPALCSPALCVPGDQVVLPPAGCKCRKPAWV